MKKSDLKESTRLSNLEVEMVAYLSGQNSKVDLQTLKDNFDGRASLKSTTSIVKLSDLINHENLND